MEESKKIKKSISQIESDCQSFLLSADKTQSEGIDEYLRSQENVIQKANQQIDLMYNRMVKESKEFIARIDELESERLLCVYITNGALEK